MVLTENEITMAQPVEGVNGQNSVIIRLRRRENAGYSFPVAAKSATGRCNPSYPTATQTPKASFFIVAALVHLHSAALIRTESMVAQAGHPQGWPVFVGAGIATPVWATTTQERCNSGGSKLCYPTEIDACQRPLPNHTHNLPGYFWLYAVLTSWTGRTATKSPPQPMTPPAALWRVITWLLLLDACRPGGLRYEPFPKAENQPARLLPPQHPSPCLPWSGKPAYHAGCRHARHSQSDATGSFDGRYGGGYRAGHRRVWQRADHTIPTPKTQPQPEG